MERQPRPVDPMGEDASERHLEHVQDGMKVVDSAGHDVGTVNYVKLTDPGAVTDEPESDEGETRPQVVPIVVAAPSTALGDDAGRGVMALPLGNVDDEFDEQVSEPVRSRLRRKGYLRVHSGFIFGKNHYVFADQIASVSQDVVKLLVTRDHLASQQ